jgi:hypothetical protein
MQGSKKVWRCLLAVLGAVMVACGEPSEKGSVHVVAVFPPGTRMEEITTVSVAVAPESEADSMSPVYGGLILTDGTWSTTVDNVAEGAGRVVSVKSFVSSFIYWGRVFEVNVQGGQTTSVTVTLEKYCPPYEEGAVCPEQP